MRRAILAPSIVIVAACGADVPTKPTWFADVQPILRANCARCHGGDPADAKLGAYRLDRYVANDPDTLDAFDKASDIIAHAVDHMAPVMPPDYMLTDRQQEVLARWAAAGAPKGTRLGGNSLARAELVSPLGLETADQEPIETVFRTWDDDLDGLVAMLAVRDETGETISFGASVGGGLRSITIDAGTLASKHTFEVYVIVDDGYDDDPEANRQHEVVLIPALYVDHGIRGTAPRVALKSPNGGNTIVGATTITWTATDPDAGDSLTIDLDLIPQNGAAPRTIVHGIPNTLTYDWTIPADVMARDGTNTPIPYKVRVTATDALGMPRNVRTDESDAPFFIEQMLTTTYSWQANTKQIFADYCTTNCHDRTGTGSNLAMCLLQYKQGENTSLCDAADQGALENRLTILNRISNGTMPPPRASPLPAEKQALLENWLLGGAPYGSGMSDDAPTFAWKSLPSPLVVPSGGVAPIAWDVSDDNALSSDTLTYRKIRATSGSSQCLNDCNAPAIQWDNSTPTWEMLTTSMLSGVMQARTFDWSIPAQGAGCYCVQGTVTDTSGNTGIPMPPRAPYTVKF
jgi:hypothetical protein